MSISGLGRGGAVDEYGTRVLPSGTDMRRAGGWIRGAGADYDCAQPVRPLVVGLRVRKALHQARESICVTPLPHSRSPTGILALDHCRLFRPVGSARFLE